MKKNFGLACAAIFLLSCGRFGNKEAGGEHHRIVSISKHLTEMLFALGKGKDIVAVDLSSTYPDSAKLKKTVGYHRALSPESIIAMEPDLVIHSNDIGPENVLPQITKAGLNVKAFGGANTFDSAKLLLKELGKFFDEEGKADSICKKNGCRPCPGSVGIIIKKNYGYADRDDHSFWKSQQCILCYEWKKWSCR